MLRPLLCWVLFCMASPVLAIEFSAEEKALIAQHGPWPPVLADDSSNRVSGNPVAVRFGERLFFDHDLGSDSGFSCASCHDPGRGFSDGKITGVGRRQLARNTPTLFNLKGNRWFGLGGENDSLWAQSIRPLLHPDEMAATPASIKHQIRQSDDYRAAYQQVFSANPDRDSEELVLVNVAKALAAYQETLITPRSGFDAFRDALLGGDSEAMADYPESAQRGLRLFIGEGRCNLCHLGPRFSNGEFEDVGIAYFIEGGVDAGRYDGIRQVRSSPFNRLGSYNDGNPAENAISTRSLRLQHRNWGEFKVPGLRGVAATAPYMHNGSLGSLQDVVQHYSNLDLERLHNEGNSFLRPLQLDTTEAEDLISFLRSLGEYF